MNTQEIADALSILRTSFIPLLPKDHKYFIISLTTSADEYPSQTPTFSVSFTVPDFGLSLFHGYSRSPQEAVQLAIADYNRKIGDELSRQEFLEWKKSKG